MAPRAAHGRAAAIASLRGFTWQNRGYGQGQAVTVGGQSFTFKTGKAVRSSPPGISEIAARSTRDTAGHFAAKRAGSWKRQTEASSQEPGHHYATAVPRALVDETGTPILYASGENHEHRVGMLASRSPISDGSDFWSGERDRAMQS